jgi:DNA replication protein DnaC
VDALPDMLARLKLTALRDRLDGLLDEAARGDLSLRETLALLCRAEVSHREQRRIQMGTGIAKFPHQRTLEGFDFAAQPSLDAKQVRDLAACRWVANGDALLIQGPPGVGKTHLAIALGREAIRQGYFGAVHSGDGAGDVAGQGACGREIGAAPPRAARCG